MKILVLCYEYPPVGGGGGRVAAQVAAALVRRGHSVRVVTAGLRHLSRRETCDGVEIFRPESFRKREDTCSVPEMALYLATSFFPALAQIRDWRPDVIHAHFAVPTGALAYALGLLTRMPYVLTVHLGDVPGGVPEQTAGLYGLLNPFIRPIWRRAKRVTAVSSFVAGLAVKAYGVAPTVIHNGVPPLRDSPIHPHSPRRIVMAGRMSVQKNPLLAADALALIKDLPWSFDVIGEGPLGSDLRARVGKLGLSGRVTFHGWKSGAEVARIFAGSDILLMTSLHEGLPMVAVEALQHGLAIIGSAIGGLQDVIDDGENGFFCATTPEAFAGRLRELLVDDARLEKMRGASRRMARAFDLENQVNAYERVLGEATRP